jgi:hypothetical protein
MVMSRQARAMNDSGKLPKPHVTEHGERSHHPPLTINTHGPPAGPENPSSLFPGGGGKQIDQINLHINYTDGWLRRSTYQRQNDRAVAPLIDDELPGHRVHDVEPACDAYVLLAHGVHVVDPGMYVPLTL